MTHKEVVDALAALGHHSGWVVNDAEIVVWELDEPKPTQKQLEEVLS